MRISDWSSDVCSSDMRLPAQTHRPDLGGCDRFHLVGGKHMQKDRFGVTRLLATTSVLLSATALPGAIVLPAQAQDAASVCASGYTEAPQLKAMVDPGTLPPVAERPPPEPTVVGPAGEGRTAVGG